MVTRTIRKKTINETDGRLNRHGERENMTATEETEPLISSRSVASGGDKAQTISYNTISLVSKLKVFFFDNDNGVYRESAKQID